MICCPTLVLVLSSFAVAPTDLSIQGFGLGAPSQASGLGTLTGTSKGRITVTADEGTWNLLVVDVALREPNPMNLNEVAEAATHLSNHPWLTPTNTHLGSTGLVTTLGGLVDGQDLAAAVGTELWVDPGLVGELVTASATNDPNDVRSYGQPVLLGETALTWRTQFPTWAGSPIGEYWLTTFSHPGNVGVATMFDVIDWTRLMENAAVKEIGAPAWRYFARSGELHDVVEFGLEVRVQAISLQANPIGAATPDPTTTPGLETENNNKPHFRISQPITIAIPYIPPFTPTTPFPYEPGVLDPNLAAGTMIAAIGRMTSATHAVFPTAGHDVSSLLFRLPDADGPLAFFDVPPGAVAGLVRFEDQDGPNDPPGLPIEPFLWVPLKSYDQNQ